MLIAMITLLAAADWVGLVVVIVALLLWGLGKLTKASSALSSRPPTRPVSSSPSAPAGPDLDELARRRREQLEMLGRRRTAGVSPDQPTNLTMEQLRQRAQAKLEYERRVAALRAGGTSPSAGTPPVVRAPPNLTVRQPASRGPGVRPPASSLPPRPQRQAPRAPSHALPAAGSHPGRPISPPRMPPQQAAQLQEVEVLEEVHRGVTDADTTPGAVPIAAAAVNLPQPTPQLMRQMMIWREILSPPLALRSDE